MHRRNEVRIARRQAGQIKLAGNFAALFVVQQKLKGVDENPLMSVRALAKRLIERRLQRHRVKTLSATLQDNFIDIDTHEIHTDHCFLSAAYGPFSS